MHYARLRHRGPAVWLLHLSPANTGEPAGSRFAIQLAAFSIHHIDCNSNIIVGMSPRRQGELNGGTAQT